MWPGACIAPTNSPTPADAASPLGSLPRGEQSIVAGRGRAQRMPLYPRATRLSSRSSVRAATAPTAQSHSDSFDKRNVSVRGLSHCGWCLCRVGERVEQGVGDLVVVARGA